MQNKSVLILGHGSSGAVAALVKSIIDKQTQEAIQIAMHSPITEEEVLLIVKKVCPDADTYTSTESPSKYYVRVGYTHAVGWMLQIDKHTRQFTVSHRAECYSNKIQELINKLR